MGFRQDEKSPKNGYILKIRLFELSFREGDYISEMAWLNESLLLQHTGSASRRTSVAVLI